MSTFKITDIFKITDKGHVLSGKIIDNGVFLPGDSAVLTFDHDDIIFKIIGVHMRNETKHYGLLISFDDFAKLSKYDLKDKEIKILNISDRKPLTKDPINWTGDLADDCTAKWAGLMLRAEWMDEDYWWWAVFDMQNDGIEIDSSNNYDEQFIGGHVSRKKAEDVAKKYLNVT